jgi:hypothetical protein
MADGETPKMWLDRVLDLQPRDAPDRTSLRDVFPRTDCFPLFLPATSPAELRALDRVEYGSLTAEYRAGLAALREHLQQSLNEMQSHGHTKYGVRRSRTTPGRYSQRTILSARTGKGGFHTTRTLRRDCATIWH